MKIIIGVPSPLRGDHLKMIQSVFGQTSYEVITLVPNQLARWPTPEEVQQYAYDYRHRIMVREPDVVLALGREAFEALGFTKPLTVSRGWTEWVGKCRVIPTWHPAKIIEQPELFQDLVNDVRALLMRITKPIFKDSTTPSWLSAVKNKVRLLTKADLTEEQLAAELRLLDDMIELENTLTDPISIVELSTEKAIIELSDRLPQGSRVVCDIETSGFDVFTDQILCIALGLSETRAAVITKTALQYAHHLLGRKDIKWTFHNAKFDIRFIQRQLGVVMQVTDDTMLLHYCLDERLGTHGLKGLCRQWLGLPDYEAELHAVLPTKATSYRFVPPKILHWYAARDVCFTWRLLNILNILFEDEEKYDSLMNLYRFLIRAENSLIEIESYGIMIDPDKLTKAEKDFTLYSKILEMRLQRIAKQIGYEGNLNPRSPKQLKEVIYQYLKCPNVRLFRNHKDFSTSREAIDKILDQLATPTGAKKLRNELELWPTPESDASLKALEEISPAVAFLIYLTKLREVSKILSTYVVAIQEMITTAGRLHTDFRLHGTVTGRLAAAKPNLLNIPRSQKNAFASRIRAFFVASPGTVLVDADYASMEMRIAAEFSHEPFWRDAFLAGLDLHSLMAEKMFGPNFKKEDRMIAKMFNFGLIYGRGASSIAIERGLEISVAEQWMRDFFDVIPQAKSWLDAQKQRAISEGILETPVGRQRRFGLVTRDNIHRIHAQACNFPVQSTASDCCLLALMNIHEWLKETGYGKALLMVHDAIIVEAKEEFKDIVAAKLKEIMEAAPKELFGANFTPFRADPEIGNSWGDF